VVLQPPTSGHNYPGLADGRFNLTFPTYSGPLPRNFFSLLRLSHPLRTATRASTPIMSPPLFFFWILAEHWRSFSAFSCPRLCFETFTENILPPLVPPVFSPSSASARPTVLFFSLCVVPLQAPEAAGPVRPSTYRAFLSRSSIASPSSVKQSPFVLFLNLFLLIFCCEIYSKIGGTRYLSRPSLFAVIPAPESFHCLVEYETPTHV